MHRTSDGVPKWSTPRSVTSFASPNAAARPSPGPAGSLSPSTTSTGQEIAARSAAVSGRPGRRRNAISAARSFPWASASRRKTLC